VKTRQYFHWVRIKTGNPFSSDMGGFLDMLRYDYGQVVEWTRTNDGTFDIQLMVTDRFPTRDRWSSFGIQTTPVSDFRTRSFEDAQVGLR